MYIILNQTRTIIDSEKSMAATITIMARHDSIYETVTMKHNEPCFGRQFHQSSITIMLLLMDTMEENARKRATSSLLFDSSLC